jgi:prophage DNA circulation protein
MSGIWKNYVGKARFPGKTFLLQARTDGKIRAIITVLSGPGKKISKDS